MKKSSGHRPLSGSGLYKSQGRPVTESTPSPVCTTPKNQHTQASNQALPSAQKYCIIRFPRYHPVLFLYIGHAQRQNSSKNYTHGTRKNPPPTRFGTVGLSNRQFYNRTSFVAVATARITRSGITTFSIRDNNTGNPEALKQARAKLAAEGYNGSLSQKAKSKMRKYVHNWITAKNCLSGSAWAAPEQQSQRICFVTLTLPSQQQHTDNELKRRCLMPFIQELKRRYGVREYLWRAEPQKTGQLHFHLLVDVEIPARQLRAAWNKQLAPLGYIEQYRQNQQHWHRNGFRVRKELLKYWPEHRQRKAYEEGKASNWSSPNSTDIHALRKIKNVVAYVVKYCAKDSQGRKLQGRLWECSETVRNLESYEVEIDATLDAVLKEIARTGEAEQLCGDGFTFYRCNSEQMLKLYYPAIASGFVTHWQEQSAKLSTLGHSSSTTQPISALCSASPAPPI